MVVPEYEALFNFGKEKEIERYRIIEKKEIDITIKIVNKEEKKRHRREK